MTFVVVPALLSAAIGFVVGTLLGDPIRRTASRQRVFTVAPHCHHCGVRLSRSQSIPLTARFGRNICSTCNNRIWPRVPWLEFTTAAVFAVVGGRVGWNWELPAMLTFAATCVAIFAIDKRHYIIPNRLTYPGLAITALLFLVAALIKGEPEKLVVAVIAAASAWLFFLIVWVINPRGIGFGDVRLAALLGLAAGWVGPGNAILAVFFGLLFGAVGGLAMVVAQRAGLREPIPFGPFLIAGAFVATFFGQSVDFVLG